MDKKLYIVANWKCNKSPDEAEIFVEQLKNESDKIPSSNTVVICPNMLSVDRVANKIQGTRLHCGIQNFYDFDGGAYTGEIALSQILGINVGFTLIGHSERREYFGETDELVNLKTRIAIASGIVPIVCIGESLEEREQDKTVEKIVAQVKTTIKDLSLGEVESIVWAYEPLWAIGTGKTATVEDADKVCHLIKATVSEMYDIPLNDVKVLYGGSVKASNFEEFVKSISIDGVLVGGASLDVEQFKQMAVKKVVRLKSIQTDPTKRLAMR